MTTLATISPSAELTAEDVTLAAFTHEAAEDFMNKAAIAADRLGVLLTGMGSDTWTREVTELLTKVRTDSYLGGFYNAAADTPTSDGEAF